MSQSDRPAFIGPQTEWVECYLCGRIISDFSRVEGLDISADDEYYPTMVPICRDENHLDPEFVTDGGRDVDLDSKWCPVCGSPTLWNGRCNRAGCPGPASSRLAFDGGRERRRNRHIVFSPPRLPPADEQLEERELDVDALVSELEEDSRCGL